MSSTNRRSEGGILPELPFTGREEPWMRVLELVGRTQLHEGQVLGIVGEAGVGKSRLKDELTRELQRRGARVWETCIVEGGPFDALLALLLGWLAFAPFSGPGGRERFAREVEWTELESTQVWQLLAAHTLHTQPVTDSRAQALVEAAFRKMLLRFCPAWPHAIVFEDFHLAAPSLRRLLEDCLVEVQQRPALLVVVERLTSSPLPRRPGCTVLELEPLGEKACRDMLPAAFRMDSFPARAMDELLAAARGNPAQLRRVLQEWIDSGTLVPDGQRFRYTGPQGVDSDGADLEVTERFASLLERDLALVCCAAAVGRSFPARTLERAWTAWGGRGVDEARITRLLASGLLERSEDGAGLSFVSPMAQEIALATIPEANRVKLRRCAARAWEATPGALGPEALAELWLAGEEPARALPYLLAAAQDARVAYDLARAEALYRRAVASVTSLPHGSADPWEPLGDVLLLRGATEEAEQAWEKSLARAGATRSPEQEVRHARRRVLAAQRSGDHALALQRCEAALESVPAGFPLDAAWLEGLAGVSASELGDLDAAERHVRNGLSRMHEEGPDAPRVAAVLQRARGAHLLASGRALNAAAAFECSLRAFEQTGDPWEISTATLLAGEAFARAHRPDLAFHFLRRAQEEKSAVRDLVGLARVSLALAGLHEERGDEQSAHAEASAGLALAAEAGEERLRLALGVTFGRIALRGGDSDSAAGEFEGVLAEAEPIGAHPEAVAAALGLSEVARRRGELDEALALARTAERRAEVIRDRRQVAEARLQAGLVHVDRGARAEAVADLEEALYLASGTEDPQLRGGILDALEKLLAAE